MKIFKNINLYQLISDYPHIIKLWFMFFDHRLFNYAKEKKNCHKMLHIIFNDRCTSSNEIADQYMTKCSRNLHSKL